MATKSQYKGRILAPFLVGIARCAVRAASSGALGAAQRCTAECSGRFTRVDAAARRPCHRWQSEQCKKAVDDISTCATLKHKMALQDTIRFRTTKTIKARFRRLARVARKDPSDLGREIIKDFVMRREAELRALGAIQKPAQKSLELEQHAA